MIYADRPSGPSWRRFAIALVAIAPAPVLDGCGAQNSEPPLDGAQSHHFGVVDFTGPDMIIEHTFTLENVAGEAIEIAKLNASCGCVTPTADAMTLGPDDDVRIVTALKPERPGRKREHVTIIFEDGRDPVRLELMADARLVRRLTVLEEAITASSTERGHLTLIAIVTAPDWPPPDPWHDEHFGVEISFSGWTPAARDDGNHDGRKWEGVLTITPHTWSADASPPDPNAPFLSGEETLVVRVGTHHEVRVPLKVMP